MKRPCPRGFTIVELLVVVAIIGVLMGLLLPAVQAARESGRRAACMNNLYQLGMAVNRYDQDFGRVPYWQNNVNSSFRSWPVVMLPYIERNDLYESYASSSGKVKVSTFLCPTTGPDASIDRPLAYAGNCGNGGTTALSKYYGVMPAIDVKYSLRDVADGDGTATTLLFAEKSKTPWQAEWDLIVGATLAFQQMQQGTSVTQSPAFGINHRPAAGHAKEENSVVAFCDGHTKFIVAPAATVWTQLTTSWNSKAAQEDLGLSSLPVLDESSY